jgi:polyisoprenoid-binding protein YceI
MTTLTNSLATGTYTVDPSHSRIGFVARHAMVTKVRGAFNDYEAVAEVNGDSLADSKVRVAIKPASVDTRSEQRDGHLRSADFFDVETYPEITFTSTQVEPVGDDVLRVTGDLFIKGVSKPVTIDFTYEGSAVDPFGNQRVGFEGQLVVNRKDWGLNWNAGLEAGGVLVSEKVTLEFEISAIKTA